MDGWRCGWQAEDWGRALEDLQVVLAGSRTWEKPKEADRSRCLVCGCEDNEFFEKLVRRTRKHDDPCVSKTKDWLHHGLLEAFRKLPKCRRGIDEACRSQIDR